jgi:hypothetical protein
MITRTEIAARIGDAQYRLANGDESLEVEQALLRLRDEIMKEETSDDVVSGYLADAVAQVETLRELVTKSAGHMPDSQLFHVGACAELARQKIARYFEVRNRAAEARIR